jgi:hypothetical protein
MIRIVSMAMKTEDSAEQCENFLDRATEWRSEDLFSYDDYGQVFTVK